MAAHLTPSLGSDYVWGPTLGSANVGDEQRLWPRHLVPETAALDTLLLELVQASADCPICGDFLRAHTLTRSHFSLIRAER